MTAPELATIPYADFVDDVKALGLAIGADGWRPDYIIGIGRGGLVPGAYLSHRTGIPLLSVDFSSRVPEFADDLLAKLAAQTGAGTRILFVDDINDSGTTIVALRDAIAASGATPANARVAVLIDNVRSAARIDYRSREIDRASDKRWFVFPWETMADEETLAADAQAVPERLS